MICRSAAVLAAFALFAAPGFGADPNLSIPQRREAVLGLADAIERHYVEAEAGRRIAADLRRHAERGAYRDHPDPRDLAGVLTRELQEHDLHFRVDWHAPGDREQVTGGHSEEEIKQWREYSRLENYGFRRVEIMPGNIGYLDLRYFDSVAFAGGTAVAAMNLLANVDALIVDLRQNGGGEPEMVQLLVSYLLGPEPVHYNSLYWRVSDETRQYWTLPAVQGARILHAPVYVLTSARTGSAAEEFAYDLQTQKRATVIGEVTAGAANPGDVFPVKHGFSVFISTGKAVNPVTGSNWEGTGVLPDIEVPSTEALDMAQARALRARLETAQSETARRGLEWALEAVEVRSRPVASPPSELERYAGAYGDRRIRFESGQLSYQRGRRAVHRIVPLGGDRFLLDGVDGFRLQFERADSGDMARLIDMWADGHVEVNVRASASE